MLEKKSVVSVILLSIFTLGIYMLWWIYDAARKLQGEGDYEDLPAAWLLVLFLFLSPVGGALFMLSAHENLTRVRYMRALPPRENSKILWILIGAVAPIVAVGVIQYEINRLFDAPQSNFYQSASQETSNFYNSGFFY